LVEVPEGLDSIGIERGSGLVEGIGEAGHFVEELIVI